jgi:hypothetical protein
MTKNDKTGIAIALAAILIVGSVLLASSFGGTRTAPKAAPKAAATTTTTTERDSCDVYAEVYVGAGYGDIMSFADDALHASLIVDPDARALVQEYNQCEIDRKFDEKPTQVVTSEPLPCEANDTGKAC